MARDARPARPGAVAVCAPMVDEQGRCGGNRPSSLVSVLIPHVTLINNARWALLTRALIKLNGGKHDGKADDISAD